MKTTIIRQNRKTCHELSMYYILFEALGRYGITVTNECSGETRTISDVSTLRSLSEQLFDLILRGFVTPVTLMDVAEDFVAEH